MSLMYHPGTGLDIGDPEKLPLLEEALPAWEEVAAAAKPLILSSSGWRKVFAFHGEDESLAPWSDRKGTAGQDKAEDSLSGRICGGDKVIVALMAEAFGKAVLGKVQERQAKPAVLLGMDSRPTGPAIADIFARVLIGMGIEVRHLFIVAAPEIMAYAGICAGKSFDDPEHAEGFAYISASHNPPGHNGLKFGIGSGGVLSGSEIAPLIASLKAALAARDAPAHALDLTRAAPLSELVACYQACTAWKRRSVSAYTLFSHELVTGKGSMEEQAAYLDALAEACTAHPLGIVAELNGSARSVSIDRDFLEGIGVSVEFHNAQPGMFVHRIVPEGSSLELCMELLEKAHGKNPAFQLGYVPDCDGDRGNLVLYDSRQKKARLLEAQEVFSLACLVELADIAREGAGRPGDSGSRKTAIVVNDGTSMRIEKLAGLFGAKVFRAETGEANVVSLADRMRSEGWTVRILGEGSNGGNITHPARVRDPLATLGAMIRLLRLPDSGEAPGLFRLWTGLASLKGFSTGIGSFDLSDVIASLPRWATTSVFEPRAALKIVSSDKVALKIRYRELFLAEWERRRGLLESRFGIMSWKAFASLGTKEWEVGEDFAASGQGGLRLVFLDGNGRGKAFLWMRGSGTEPVFRIMADIEGGDRDDEAWFLDWHAAMVRAADGQ
jgi:phosphomannomutase